MRLKWILAGIGALVVALVVTAVAILMSLDLNQYRGRIAAEVEAYTGRKASISGPIKLEISLSPAVAVEDVTLANATWGTRPEMLKVKRFEAKVELLPLLSGSVHIRRIVLEDADILLETDKSGTGNWVFGKPAATTGGEAAQPQPQEAPAESESGGEFKLPTVNDVTIERSTVTYRDGRTGKVTTLALDKLVARSESTRSPLIIDFAGRYNDIPVEINGTLGSIAGLMAGARLPVDLEASTTGLELRLLGEVDRPGAERGTELQVTAEGVELGALSKLAGAKVPALGPYKISLNLKESKRGFAAEAIEVVIGREDLVLASATGAISDLRSVAGVNLQVELKGRSLAALGPALGASLPAAGPYQASAHISGGRKAMKLENLAITVAGSDIAGDATLSLGGPRPRLDAVLGSVNLDIDDLGLEAGSGGGGGSGASGGAGDGRVFPADPIRLDALRLIDGTLTFAGKKVVAAPVSLDNVTLKLALANGRLTVQPAEANVTGGTMRLEAVVNGTGGTPSVKLRVTARRVEAGALLELLQVKEVLSGGRADLDLDVAGHGGSVRALMAGLDGSTSLVMGPGRIDNRFARILLADVGQLVTGSASGDSSNVNCVVSRFVITKGRAESQAMILDTNGATIEGSGTINLAEERLALGLVPRAKQTNLASLAVPLRVTGTLASPTVIPDPGAIAVGVVESVARTPGSVVDTLVGLVDGSSGSGPSEDPCAAAKSAATGAVKPAGTSPAVSGAKTKSSGSGSLPGSGSSGSGGVEGLVKGFSQSLDSVFGGSGGGGTTSGAGKQPVK